MDENLKKLKEVIRLTRVSPGEAGQALDKIRALLAPASTPAPPPSAPKRESKATPDRLERGGRTRAATSSEDE